MTHDERVQILRRAGYTPSQAPFLAHVMVHGGYFLRRQFAAATGRPDGGTATDFLRRLRARGHARRSTFGRGSEVYHVHHRGLYEATGEPASPSQRRVRLRAVVRRLMTLDVALMHSATGTLATANEKVEFFGQRLGLSEDLFPSVGHTWSARGRRGAVRPFPDQMPILLNGADDGVTLVYVHGPASTLAGFSTYLESYAPLLTQLPKADVAFCTVDVEGFDAPVRRLFERWRRTAPTHRRASLAVLRRDLERHFHRRRAQEAAPDWRVCPNDRAAVGRGNRRFAHPRYAGLFGWWSVAGNRVLDDFVAREPGVDVAHVGLCVCPIAHRYDLFGTAIARDLRWRQQQPIRRRPRSDSAPLRAA
jgi:hypothetical protein